MSDTDSSVVEVRVNAALFDWLPGEQRQADIRDPEILALIKGGLLTLVDDSNRDLLPKPESPRSARGGCGCGH